MNIPLFIKKRFRLLLHTSFYLCHYKVLLIIQTKIIPKSFWDTIKRIFPTKCTSRIPPSTDEASIKANSFCSYFSTIVQTLKGKIFLLTNTAWKMPKKSSSRTDKVFRFKYVSKIFVEKELKSFKRKKATGLDNLPPSLLKDCASSISKPLCFIINLSLQTKSFPNIWKRARVVPAHKSGPTNLPENFRPISILPALSKILEKAVHLQLTEFLDSNKLLSNRQFGYRSKRSTDLAATLLCDDIRREVNDRKFVGAVFIDLSHAFDTISHSNLLSKLATYGISNDELEWFECYLFNRVQVVDINGTYSIPKPVFSGVTQRSILGPLMFL